MDPAIQLLFRGAHPVSVKPEIQALAEFRTGAYFSEIFKDMAHPAPVCGKGMDGPAGHLWADRTDLTGGAKCIPPDRSSQNYSIITVQTDPEGLELRFKTLLNLPLPLVDNGIVILRIRA